MIDFGLTEDEEMVVSMAERFGATELRPTAREREARGSVEAGLHAAFSAAGLDLLARDHADASEVSLAARAMAIEHLAHADAGAAIRLWFGALSAAWGERLGGQLYRNRLVRAAHQPRHGARAATVRRLVY